MNRTRRGGLEVVPKRKNIELGQWLQFWLQVLSGTAGRWRPHADS